MLSSSFTGKIGGDYLKIVIGDLINQIVFDPELSLEIDPRKLQAQVAIFLLIDIIFTYCILILAACFIYIYIYIYYWQRTAKRDVVCSYAV